ncbi:5105_t:CDS:10 [Paraglomus occultum]|uniref:5105_t:CDS:1 n=1 Tax=Paraglomus occultum TaxID=144539 RepID=A0A9N9B469_9GLOM|nr:5105_t:CDS:10 [Paraglomus occultum]
MSFLLASASQEVKVWDLVASSATAKPTGNASFPEQLYGVELSSFVPSNRAGVRCARWSHDNQLLGVGQKGSVSIHDHKGTIVEQIPLHIEKGSEYPDVKAVRFNNKSKCVMFGGSDKIVYVWDRTESQYDEPLKGHRSAITSIDLNIDETLVASASDIGNIIIHSRTSLIQSNLTVLTGQNTKSTQPMNVLEYSHFKRGLLAAGSEDGYLRIWDTSASTTALQTFESAHFGPVRGIAFSPFNSQLMCSSGMDKRIVLYDVGKRSILKNIHTEFPLTALAFKPDGVTIAAGTLQGKIIVYDLRSTSKSVCTLLGHEPHPVHSLCFQIPVERNKPLDRKSSSSRPKSHSRSSSGKTQFNTPKANSSMQSAKETKDKNYMEMFSPVKDGDDAKDTKDIRASIMGAINGVVLSPTTESLAIKAAAATAATVRATTETANTTAITKTTDTVKTTKTVKSIKPIKTVKNSAATIAATPNISPSPKPAAKVSSEEQKNDVPSSNTASGVSQFQYQVLENVISECLHEFRTAIKNDIQDMHLELLRQFHIQKTDMELMFMKYCGDTVALKEEITRLREENERLRMRLL